MKTEINTKNFFRISLLTITLAGIPMFAVKFEEPKKYTPVIGGVLLRQVITMRHRKFLKLPPEKTEKTRVDIKEAAPKLSEEEIGQIINYRDTIKLQSNKRNKVNTLIEDSNKKIDLLKIELKKVQPTYKKDAKLNSGLAQEYGNKINILKQEIETKGGLLGTIDTELLKSAEKINTIFVSNGYKSSKRNDKNSFWKNAIYKKEPAETKKNYEKRKKQLKPKNTNKLKRQLRLQ